MKILIVICAMLIKFPLSLSIPSNGSGKPEIREKANMYLVVRFMRHRFLINFNCHDEKLKCFLLDGRSVISSVVNVTKRFLGEITKHLKKFYYRS